LIEFSAGRWDSRLEKDLRTALADFKEQA